ncbi:SIR2 family protein [Lentisphaerota bacterium WC36G]|nr:SIR2 family protein [Lentisphaerae bacterium WC36]
MPDKKLQLLLKDAKTFPFLFIGSGISRRYLNFPNWQNLLEDFAQKIKPHLPLPYKSYERNLREEDRSNEYLKFPAIASLISDDFSKKIYEDVDEEDFRNRHYALISRDVDPFKIAVAEKFKKDYYEVNDNYTAEVQLLKSIQNKIAGIITTNYDLFLEKCFPNFTTYIGQNDLLFKPIYNIAEIYKIHGCCSKPESIIINKDDYKIFDEKNPYLAAKLITFFIEHPIIFLGYSISDPNIKKIFGAIANGLTNEQLLSLGKRLIFIEFDENCQDPTHQNNIITVDNGQRINVELFKTSSFEFVYKAIQKNRESFKPQVLRTLKQHIYELVKTNEPIEKVRAVGIEDVDNIEDLEVVIGVGVHSQIGYGSLEPKDLYLDLLYDNKNFDNNKIVELTIPDHIKHFSGSTPMHKYCRHYEDELPNKVQEKLKTSFEDYITRSMEQSRKNKTSFSIENILSIHSLDKQEDIQGFVIHCLKLQEEEIDINLLKESLIKIVELDSDWFASKHNSQIKKLLQIYDFLKYHKK